MTTDAFYQHDHRSPFSWRRCQIIVSEDSEGISSVLTPDNMTIQLPADRVIVIPDSALPEDTYIRDPEGIIWKVDYLTVMNSKLSYKLVSVDPRKRFKPYQFVPIEDLWTTKQPFELLESSPYLSQEDLEEHLYEAHNVLGGIKDQIRELQKELQEKEKKLLRPIQEACEHVWETGEEEEGEMTMLGRSISRIDQCEICDLERTVHSVRIC